MNADDANESSWARDFTGVQDLESTARFLEISFDAVVAFDAQGRINYWNPAAEQLYGWRAHEAIDKSPTELFCQAGIPYEQENQKDRQSRLRQGDILRGKFNACRKDGSSLWVEYATRGFFDEAGKLIRYVTVYRDIANQTQAREKIIEVERKFSTLFDKAGFAAALSKPPDGILVDVNEAWVETFGYTREEAIGKTTLELNINPDVEERARILAQLREKGSARNIETRLQTKSGEWRIFLTNLDFIEIDGQKYILNTAQDITDRKRAEDAHRASEERYRVVLESATDAIVVTNPSEGGKVLSANPAACRMFGYSIEEFQGLSREDMLDTSDPNLAALLEERKQFGQASAEVTYKRKNGTRFRGELSSGLYRDQNGEERAVAIIRDITERKRAEEELERSNERLNQILSSIQDDFYVLDRDWRFVYTSRSFTSKIGKEPEDFAGNIIWEMFPKHVGSVLEENFRAAMEKREIRRFEIPGKYTNAWYRMTAFPSAEGITVLGTDISERRRAEEQLRELSQRLTYHVDNSPLAVIEWGPDMRLTRWSGAAERIFGWKAEEVLGKRIEDFRWVYEEDTEQVQGVSADLKTGADARRFSANRNYRKDGSVVYCEWYNSSLLDEAGHLRSILSLVLDVTDRKQADQELQYQATLLANVNDAIIASDAQFRITAWNTAAETLYGWKAEEVLGCRGVDLLQTEWPEQGAAEMRRVIAEIGHWRGEATQARKDGSRFAVEVSSIVLYDEHQQVMGYVSVNRDITERKRAEEELRQSEERYRHLVQHAPAGIYEIDLRTGRFLDVNDAMCQILGYRREELLSMMPGDLLDEEGKERFRQRTRKMVAREKVSEQTEYKVRAKDGHEIWGVLNTTVNYEKGQARSVSVIAHDVTERKKAEQALLENQKQLQLLNETLEEKVQEKTAEVRRLASDLTKAEQRQRHRISQILHEDLQQRLFAIQMQLALFREQIRVGDESANTELAEIKEQLDEMLMITRRLSIDLSPPILQNEGLFQAIGWLAAQMKEQHGLQTKVQGAGSFAISDTELQVLVYNCVRELLLNVVHHAEVKEAIIVLRTSGKDLYIEVRDQGKGFILDAAGLPGSAPEGEAKDRRPGLSLVTIRNQLSLFGGRMEIKSEPGGGTQVVLIVPVSEGL